jgi:NAD(P)-dependent dehydrogenase (short-subunit alcohol dehydrogenase family)
MTEAISNCAFITGSASGLGRGLALVLAERGTPLALVDLSTEGLEETKRLVLAAGSPKVTVHGKCDVSSPEVVTTAARAALEAHGAVSHVICNAGVGFVEPLSQTTLKDLQWLFGVNTFGVYNTIMAFLPTLKSRGAPAKVLFTASMAAIDTPPGWNLGVYSGSKFAVAALAQGLRDDVGTLPITVSVAYPGMVATNITANATALRPAAVPVGELPDEFKKKGMDPVDAARIIIAGVDRGMRDIFTHPEELFMLNAYTDRLAEGFRLSAELAKS